MIFLIELPDAANPRWIRKGCRTNTADLAFTDKREYARRFASKAIASKFLQAYSSIHLGRQPWLRRLKMMPIRPYLTDKAPATPSPSV